MINDDHLVRSFCPEKLLDLAWTKTCNLNDTGLPPFQQVNKLKELFVCVYH